MPQAVGRSRPWRDHPRPDRVLADKAYSSRAIRAHLRTRGIGTFKHWRGLATRYDKHAIVYRAGLVLTALLLWLTDLGDTS